MIICFIQKTVLSCIFQSRKKFINFSQILVFLPKNCQNYFAPLQNIWKMFSQEIFRAPERSTQPAHPALKINGPQVMGFVYEILLYVQDLKYFYSIITIRYNAF